MLKRGEKLTLGPDATEADLADLGLRFDLTVPLARYYAHNHAKLPTPLRAVQIGPVWRAERPQRGRYRQFTQCDIDILGVGSEIAEIELILATTEALGELGLGGLTVRINDRRLLAADGHLVRLRAGAPRERLHHPRQVGQALTERDPSGARAGRRIRRPAVARMLELYGQPASAQGLAAMRSQLGEPRRRRRVRGAVAHPRTPCAAAAGDRFRIDFDPTLVRGMGYYTGPIFEIGSSSFAAGSIAGGGRYDGMIGALLGRPVPATGFLDRIRAGHRDPGPSTRSGGRAPTGSRCCSTTPRRGSAAPCGRPASSARRATSWRSSAKRGAWGRSVRPWRSRGTTVRPRSGSTGRSNVQWFAERAPPRDAGSRE